MAPGRNRGERVRVWGAGMGQCTAKRAAKHTATKHEKQSMRPAAPPGQGTRVRALPCSLTSVCAHTAESLPGIWQLVILQTAGTLQLRCDTYNYSLPSLCSDCTQANPPSGNAHAVDVGFGGISASPGFLILFCKPFSLPHRSTADSLPYEPGDKVC